jgi:predicted dehydrogenase
VTDPTRIGIVGAGSVAQRHAEVLGGFDDVEIAGVTDVAADAAQALAGRTGARAYPGLAELLDDAGPDAVYVCVPPFAHGEPERTLIERGVPLFVEKPLAVDLDVAEDLAAGIAERGLVTATGYHWRYMEGVERARALLAGAPAQLVSAAWLDKVPPPAWWIRRERSGGQVIEQATHLLDVALDLVGDVDVVHAFARRVTRPEHPDSDVDDATVATLVFASGAIGTLAATSLLRRKARAAIELVADGRRIEVGETALVVDEGDGPVTTPDPGTAKTRVDRAFVDAVRGEGDDVRAPYATALRTHRVATAIARSALEGAPVRVRG